jgi:hypothetical protein
MHLREIIYVYVCAFAVRSYDFPQVSKEDRLDMMDVCDKRALAIAIVNKCTSLPAADIFALDAKYPQNLSPVFGGGRPANLPHPWYGNNWTEFNPVPTDDTIVVDAWDGCTLLPGTRAYYCACLGIVV